MTEREDDSPGPGRREIDDAADRYEPRFDKTPREGSRDFRSLSADFRADILDHEDEVIVVAELPGAEEGAIRISLLNPHTLRITARRAGPVQEGAGAYSIRERGNGIMSRLIRLPASVTGEGAKTRFKNGVLELRLTKMKTPPGPGGTEIPIG